ncbi:MAG: prolyl oligopeptidase family serine peptidase [Opitutaceae bacterium]|nr:prolyl oligopeptidase family serine peptidase [Opitutaceae bacterium]
MRTPLLSLFAASFCAAGLAHADSFDERVAALFRPPLDEWIALSPDGHRVAYTTRTDGELEIVMMSIEPPGQKKTVAVDPDRAGAAVPAGSNPPTQLRFLRWATERRLVYAPVARVVPLPPIVDASGRSAPNPDGPTVLSPILATDADGRQRGTLVDARDFQEAPEEARRSLADFLRTPTELAARRKGEPVRWRMPHLDILGFFPRDREQLIIGTRGAYSMPLRHLVDIRNGHVQAYGEDWPAPPGEPQVYDWFLLKVVGERQPAARPTTAWQDEDLRRVQQRLEAKFPRRIVELLDWSETRARVLFRVTGGRDAGRLFVWQRMEDIALEILPRAPWLNAAKLNETRWFDCAAPDGARLSGYLTWPAQPRATPPPLLVIFPAGFPGRAQPAFDPEAQVFADLGFAVARLNHRSVAGIRPEDTAALRAGLDRMAVDDARTVLAWIATHPAQHPFDRRRVAALGRGFGGYLALRALQREPAVFRSGIALDAPLALRPSEAAHAIPADLIEGDGADGKAPSVLDQVEALTQPVLLLVEPGRNPAIDTATAALRAQLKGLGRSADQLDLDPGFATGQPTARATVYRKIEEFLNLHLDAHSVKIGPTKEVR